MREGIGGIGARLWFGLAILLLGVLWTLDNLDIIESEPLLRWWPAILIGFGIVRVLGLGGPARIVAGLVWIVAGGLLLGHSLGYVPWGLWEFWPVVLIVFGASIAWNSFRGPGHGVFGRLRGTPESGGPRTETSGPPDADRFSCVSIWAGVDRKVTSQAVRGGDYTAFMGGGTIDLRGARPVAEGAVIEVFVLMGGVDIIVPEDWRVVNDIFAFMGGVEDSRKSQVSPGPHTLFVKGFVMMGGVEVKS